MRSGFFLATIIFSFAIAFSTTQLQRVEADDSGFDVNGVVTVPQGSGGAGYSSSSNDSNSAVRVSDSNPTAEGYDRAMEKELSPNYTSNQRTARSGVPFAGAPIVTTPARFAQLDKMYGGTLPRYLPEARFDSLVHQAGGLAEFIYNDEGVFSAPPLSGFTERSRINAAIFSPNLSTGHHDESLPSAGGYPN